MSMGIAWAESTPGSASKKNKTSVITDTGANLAALDKTKFKIVTASSTGSGFTLNHAYLFTEDGLSKVDLTSVADHTHSGTGDGGNYVNIIAFNGKIINLELTRTNDLQKAQWIQTLTGTGTIEDDTSGSGERSIRLRPNGTSGSGSTISYPHLKLDFTQVSAFAASIRIETATSCAAHMGVGADDITAADSNTRKYQAEFCTTTNNNWWLRTATGSAQSASDSGVAIDASKDFIKMIHNPTLGTPTVDLYPNSSTTFQKTTNIPTDSTTTNDNILKFSIKNNTGADRPLKMYGCKLTFELGEAWG